MLTQALAGRMAVSLKVALVDPIDGRPLLIAVGLLIVLQLTEFGCCVVNL